MATPKHKPSHRPNTLFLAMCSFLLCFSVSCQDKHNTPPRSPQRKQAKNKSRLSLTAVLQKLHSSALSERKESVQELGTRGTITKEALEVLERIVRFSSKEPAVHQQALKTQARYQADLQKTLEGLRKATQDQDSSIRKASSKVLASLLAPTKPQKPKSKTPLARPTSAIQAPSKAPSLASLQRDLADSDENVRFRAAFAMSKQGIKDEKLLPTLLQALKHEKKSYHLEAIEILGKMGKDAAPATQPLTRIFHDADPSCRAAARKALANIGPSVIPAILQALQDKTLFYRYDLVRVLGDLKAKQTIPFLLQALRKGVPYGHGAIQVFEILGLRDANVSQALIQMFKAPHHDINKPHLIKALVKRGPAVLPLLLKALQDPNVQIRLGVLETLRSFGSSAQKTVPSIKKSLQDENLSVRFQAASALWKIEANTQDTIPIVQELLKQEEVITLQLNALRLLSEMGPKASPAIPALLHIVKTSDTPNMLLMLTLKDIRSTDPRILETLLQHCQKRQKNKGKDKHEEIELSLTLGTLASLYPRSKRVASTLTQILKTERDLSISLEHFGKLESLPQEAIPLLLEAMRHPELLARNAAKRFWTLRYKTPPKNTQGQ